MADLSGARAAAIGAPLPARSAAVEESRLVALDGLRGIAAISVLLIHIGYMAGNRELVPIAFLAVDLFFMLSGFVIGYAYEPKLLGGMRWRSFMKLRAVRFFPTLAAGVLLAAALEVWLGRASPELGLRVLLSLLLVPDVTSPVLFPLNGVLWTLFFEIVMNAAHALFVRRLSNLRLALLALICGCSWAWAAGASGDWGGGWNWASFAGGFARAGWSYGIGLLLYRLIAAGRLRLPSLPALLPFGAAIVLLLAPKFQLGMPRIVVPLFLLLPLIVLLTAHARMTPAARQLASWFGGLSYPLYAMHPPLLLAAAPLIGSHPQAASLWSVAGILIVLIAASVAHLYETPVRKWLKRRFTGSPDRPA